MLSDDWSDHDDLEACHEQCLLIILRLPLLVGLDTGTVQCLLSTRLFASSH